MKFCSQCGERLDDASLFCSNCGARQQSAGTEAAAAASAAGYAAAQGACSAAQQNGYEAAQQGCEAAQNGYEAAQQGYETVKNGFAASPAGYPDAGSPYAGYAPAYGVQDTGYEPAPTKAKKKKTGLIVGLCALAALIVAAALLFVTGAYASLLPASKLKLGLAERKLVSSCSDEWDDCLSLIFDGVDASFDATLDIDYAEDSCDAELFEALNEFKLQGGVKTGDELRLGLRGDYKGNTAADLRLIVNRSNAYLYLAPVADDLYTASIDRLLERFAPDFDSSKLDILFKKLDKEGVKADVNAVRQILENVLAKAQIDIEKNVDVKLFNGEEAVEGCAVYTVKLTEDEIKQLLTDIADYLDSDDCYVKEPLDEFIRLLVELGADVDLGEPFADDPAPAEGFADVTARLREIAPRLASEYVENNFMIEITMKGSEIIRHRLYNDDGEVGIDCRRDGNTEHYMTYYGELGEEHDSYSDVKITSAAAERKVQSVAYSDGELAFKGSMSVDPRQRSAIGTYEGSYEFEFYDYCGDKTEVTIKVTRSGNTYEHDVKVTLSEDDAYYTDMNSIGIRLDVKEGSGVETPAGIDTEDVSEYSEMQFYQLYYKLMIRSYSALQDVFGD